ncbi:MAG: sugar nucleotidyltransferase, partial [Alphaproteobacteria bacterium]
IGRGGIINAGAYWVDRDIVKEIIDPPCSLEKDIFPTLSKRRLIRGFVYSGKFIDIGVPEDLVRAQKVLG